MFDQIKNVIDNIIPNFMRVENESRYYTENVFKSNFYICHQSWNDTGNAISYIYEKECHIFSMGVQDHMIKSGWLKETHRDEYRDMTILEDWLKNNIKGFYDTRRWGNGRHEYGQSFHGLWHVEIYIMREEDAVAFKLRWS